jgi:SEC-C motif-containing protein
VTPRKPQSRPGRRPATPVRPVLDEDAACPCGSGNSYGPCCGRLHRGEANALTAEQLMRSRYSAFAVRDAGYLLRTWHPSTRPPGLAVNRDQVWTGLEVMAHSAGGLLDADGMVEFRAHYTELGDPEIVHERSTFTRSDGAWVYVGADREPG